ncbi:MAG: phosphatidylglycerophosphatase A [Terriglobales bacterium]
MTPETREVPPSGSPRAPHWAWMVATFFGAGFLRPGPGTWGSLAALGLWWYGARFLPGEWRPMVAFAASMITLAVGIPAATRVAQEKGDLDPAFVVIDEFSGQMLAFVAIPLQWKPVLAAFILFRVFDIVKPPPLRRLERIPGGTGIMLDDIGAGLLALVAMHLLLHFGILR